MSATIEPHRLKEARIGRGLTRAELEEVSRVSARHIKRIEDAHEPVQCRPETAERLAQALAVGVPVLKGDAPVPGDIGEGPRGRRIDADRLRRLREKRGWSQKRLAEESRMSLAQIRRVEQGKVGAARRHTLDRLAQALRVEAGVLTGSAPIEEKTLPSEAKVQLGARVSAEVRLAYDLVSRSYGAGVRDVVQLAPLLFVLLAEGSLGARRVRLDRAREKREELSGLADEPMLYFAKYLRDVDAGIEAEERSIAAKDVLGRCIWESGDRDRRFHEDDLMVTPFEDYLVSLAKRLDPEDVRIEAWPEGMTDLWGVSSYRVCGRLLEETYGAELRGAAELVLGALGPVLRCGTALGHSGGSDVRGGNGATGRVA